MYLFLIQQRKVFSSLVPCYQYVCLANAGSDRRQRRRRYCYCVLSISAPMIDRSLCHFVRCAQRASIQRCKRSLMLLSFKYTGALRPERKKNIAHTHNIILAVSFHSGVTSWCNASLNMCVCVCLLECRVRCRAAVAHFNTLPFSLESSPQVRTRFSAKQAYHHQTS